MEWHYERSAVTLGEGTALFGPFKGYSTYLSYHTKQDEFFSLKKLKLSDFNLYKKIKKWNDIKINMRLRSKKDMPHP